LLLEQNGPEATQPPLQILGTELNPRRFYDFRIRRSVTETTRLPFLDAISLSLMQVQPGPKLFLKGTGHRE